MSQCTRITPKRSFQTLGALLFLAATASAAHAGTIIDPVSVSTDMGTDFGRATDNVRNQVGLTPGYTSGVTELNTYLNTNPLHDGVTFSGQPSVSNRTNVWMSAGTTVTGNFDFDLGGSMSIDAFLFWSLGTETGTLITANVAGFTLLAADNPSFTNATTIGSFTSTPAGDEASVRVEVFAFSQVVTASYVRMEITSNDGDGDTGFGQAAFDGVPAVPSPVPLPAAVWSGMTLLVGLGLAGKFRKNHQLQG